MRRASLQMIIVALAVAVSTSAMAVTITEFPIPTASSAPRGITAGPDGKLWFTEESGDKIATITTAGVITEFATGLTAASQPHSIVTGPDGNLWFTEQSGNQIGRITPGGVITEFAVPTPNGFPTGIIVGPDGTLIWFTEEHGNKIGHFDPATPGVISELTVPTASSRPTGIASGPDGNIWFTEYASGGNKIGRVTPAGVFTEFPVATPASDLSSIKAGPDGNLWFTEAAGNKIGRITPAGVITEFALPSANSRPSTIRLGPEGDLWFTEAFANRIGRISPVSPNAITEFPIPTAGTKPRGITAGPDGNLWFTEELGNRVGKLVRPVADDLGFIPPDMSTAKCENNVAKKLAELMRCITLCHVRAADAALAGKGFNEEACESTDPVSSCRAKYDAATSGLIATGTCPPCLDAAGQANLASQVEMKLDGHTAGLYCAGSVALGADDPGFVPPDKPTASCEDGAAKNLNRLMNCLTTCHVKMATQALKGKVFDEEACESTGAKSCRAKYNSSANALLATNTCPMCLDATGQATLANGTESDLDGYTTALYCAGTVPLPAP